MTTKLALTFTKVFMLTGLMMLTVHSVTGKSLIARVSMSGIKGTVKFAQTSQSDSTTIYFNLDGMSEELTVRIYSLPMMYQGIASTSCSSLAIGTIYDPTNLASGACSVSQKQNCAIGDISGKFGNLNQTSSKNNFTDSNLPLSGNNGIYSRTLVFLTTSGVAKACALVTSENPGLTAIARFKGPVAGTVYIRQAKEQEASLLYANLFFVNDSVANREFFLEIHDKKCSDIGGVYNPFGIVNKNNCNKTNHAGCPVGDIKDKLGYVNVSEATPSLSNTQVAYTDANLPVLGEKTVIGRLLVLYARDDPATPIACTNILKILKRAAKASFTAETTEGVTGTFKFAQQSPFDPTDVEINISNLKSKAEGFHVHEYPNPSYKQIKDNAKACSNDIAGGHLNPYGINAAKSPKDGTFDEYEIGDLSAKYGSFLNQDKRISSYSDLNLPLFGKNSIIGRSVVIHYLKKDGNKRWVCRNIEVEMSATTSLVVTQSHFTGPDIKGDIIMGQYITTITNAAPFDTAIYLDLVHTNGEESSNHNWHVHENKVGDDMTKTSGRCQSPGPHFNPYNVYVKGNYASTCKPDNPLRCELGDTSNKNAQYSLGSGPKFYTDIDTPLSGDNLVIGRSIVIHEKDGGAARQGCADIVRYEPPTSPPSAASYLSTMVSLIVAGLFFLHLII